MYMSGKMSGKLLLRLDCSSRVHSRHARTRIISIRLVDVTAAHPQWDLARSLTIQGSAEPQG
ncbi:uncharacterized protein SETTUDRAFT_163901 [Exserohilum turcica Et28A]|uniref:Uncharacterized protein n=1 Tax=Exserohilum turcicum (strain 28A) TaxID=671987 RepID=R0IK26_EXST2|nr:uncharacterized protein SETTUDRAFT_163901 [Exserohilum turcica Et28A]EOA85211.1 hypothetical protein SETTUDRAFT_163901 [Exserohilum turcica Et28A]